MHTDNYKNKMNDDISQSVSQGSNGAQDEKDSRIAAIANELERLCQVHEAQCGNSQQNVSRLDAEQRAAEQMAKSQGYWIPMMDIFNLMPRDRSLAQVKMLYLIDYLLFRELIMLL